MQRARKPVARKLDQIARKFQKPILFTEYGYRSIDYSTQAPWDSEANGAVNDSLQCRALEALYQTFYPYPWFAGGFLWKWYDSAMLSYHSHTGGYSPQGKPAEKIVSNWFGKTGISKN